MNWTLPTGLLLVACAAALVPLADLLRRPAPLPRLIGEAVNTTLVMVAAVQLTWAAILWFEDRR